MEHETFFTLIKDLAHWEFELFLIFIFDVLIGLIIWPYIKRFLTHHDSDDERIDKLEEQMKELLKK